MSGSARLWSLNFCRGSICQGTLRHPRRGVGVDLIDAVLDMLQETCSRRAGSALGHLDNDFATVIVRFVEANVLLCGEYGGLESWRARLGGHVTAKTALLGSADRTRPAAGPLGLPPVRRGGQACRTTPRRGLTIHTGDGIFRVFDNSAHTG